MALQAPAYQPGISPVGFQGSPQDKWSAEAGSREYARLWKLKWEMGQRVPIHHQLP